MSRLDELREELIEVQRRLDQLPATAFDERIALRERQRELRAAVREEHHKDRAALEQELDELTVLWDRLAGQRIDIVKQAGDLSAGGNFGFVTDALKLNKSIDAAGDREAIETRIREIRRLLA